jgi:hypothetical protein
MVREFGGVGNPTQVTARENGKDVRRQNSEFRYQTIPSEFWILNSDI